MRKATGGGVPSTVEEYLARVPEPARSVLSLMRETIRSVVPPESTEAISYGIPTFRYEGALVGLAAFKKHCSFFPMSAATVAACAKELQGFETSKGTIRFSVEKPLPAALVKKIVKARIAENEREK